MRKRIRSISKRGFWLKIDTYGKWIIDRWFTKWVIFETRHIISFFVSSYNLLAQLNRKDTHFSMQFSRFDSLNVLTLAANQLYIQICFSFFFSCFFCYSIERMQFDSLRCNFIDGKFLILKYHTIHKFSNIIDEYNNYCNHHFICEIFFFFFTSFCHDSSPNGD